VVDDFQIEAPKTKLVAAMLRNMGLAGRKVLLVSRAADQKLVLSCRNLPLVSYKRAANVNPYDLAHCDTVVFTRSGLAKAAEVFK
jgi:large subunit ribosomal protein L4